MLIRGIVLIICLFFTAPAFAAVYTITANTAWSALSPQPTSADDIIVKNGAVLTVDIANAQINNVQLGQQANPNGGNGTLAFAASSQLMVAGLVNCGDGPRSGTIDMANGGALITPAIDRAGNATNAILIPGTGTIEFTATDIPPANFTAYNNLIIGGGTFTLATNTTINGNLTISGSTLETYNAGDALTYNIDIAGNWDNSGVFNEQTSTVTFTGGNAQAITNAGGNERFYNLTINKSADDITLNAEITIGNVLTLSSGNIITNGNNIILENAAAISGGGAASYVQTTGGGNLRKNFDATGTFNFPIGDASAYTPYSVTINTAVFAGGEYLEVNVINAPHPQINTAGDYINRYWNLNSGGFSVIDYNFSAIYPDADVVGVESSLITSLWDASTSSWITLDPVDAANNTISSSSGITLLPSGNGMTAGNGVALPVELAYFNAVLQNSKVVLTWQTASERNCAYFVVERSKDGEIFEELARIESKSGGFSLNTLNYDFTDLNPLPGLAYYRLKQVDVSGETKTFSAVPVKNKKHQLDIKINSSVVERNGAIFISVFNPEKEYKNLNLIIYDLGGRKIFEESIPAAPGELYSTQVQPGNMPEGMYIVSVFSDGQAFLNQKLLVN